MKEKEQFGFWISVLNRSSQVFFQKKMKQYGLGPSEQGYLLSIGDNEKISQEVLVDRLFVDKANVSRAVTSLEIKGFIKRIRSSDDKRAYILSLTDEGKKLKLLISKELEKWMSMLQEGITNEDWCSLTAMISNLALKAHDYVENI